MQLRETSLPSKRELLSFESEWIRRAGAAALIGAFIIAAGLVYQRVGLDLPDSDSDADQLTFAHAHSGRLILSALIQGLGFVLFAFPLYFLFRSARSRAERMRGAFTALAVIGPIAFGAGLAVSAVGSSDAADHFISQEPQVVREARQQAEQRQEATTNQKQGSAGTSPTTTQGAATGTGTTGTATSVTGATTTAAVKTPDQAARDARENLADDINGDTGLLIAGGLVSTVGVLATVFGLVYTSIWAMRVGLLTRFMGALGIAFGLFLVIPLFPPIPGLVLWFAVLGLMFLGVWPRPLPPAWAAGEAIPWQRPGEGMGPPPSSGPPGTVEGSGREVSEPPLPEEAEPAEQPAETPGQRRKKRKRRK